MSGHQCNLVDVVKIGVVNQLVCLLHSIWWLIYSRENFESNNISILWKLYSMFRLKALEMTIPMVCHTYIYHEWKRTFWGKNGPKTDHFWRKVRFADFRRQNGPKYQLCLKHGTTSCNIQDKSCSVVCIAQPYEDFVSISPFLDAIASLGCWYEWE